MIKRLTGFALLLFLAASSVAEAQPLQTAVSQMEKLDRGLVALPAQSRGTYLSWRLLGTDDLENMTFDVLRNGIAIKNDLYTTSCNDENGSAGYTYQVVTKVNGTAIDTTAAVKPWANLYLRLQTQRPEGGTTNDGAYTYNANDCSVGDVDGDGCYEIILKWEPSNAKDNSQSGYTGNVLLDCYKLDGTQLWRIDLGRNIRAGAHYTQFMVYDFDGDGKAELICKTAPGSKDGKGNYVNQATDDERIKGASNTKSWLVSGGRVNGGQEYLTVFRGETGEAIHTIAYQPNRNAKSELSEAAGTFDWYAGSDKSDKGSYGNRGERYLAAVAFLDGPDQKPSGIFCRGYYSYAYIWAVDFDGEKLKHKWLHRSDSSTKYSVVDSDGNQTEYTPGKPTGKSTGSRTMFANGNHNLSVADVDGDGCDEIIWGSAAVDNDGKLLYATGHGHGDAIHLADHCPDRPGLELFQIHEESPYGWDLHDAATGEIIHSATGGGDNGRGIAGNFDSNVRGSLFWSSNDGSARSAVTGLPVSSNHGSSNFRIFWDGDSQDELLDGNKLDKWNGNGSGRLFTIYDAGPGSTCNGSKNTPNLQADILGDWREEVILWDSSTGDLAIYTSNIETGYRVPTLMHDHTYRLGVAWQNVAYNQPPHLGYYLPDSLAAKLIGEKEVTVGVGEPIEIVNHASQIRSFTNVSSKAPDGTTKGHTGLIEGFERTFNSTAHTLTLKGTPTQIGDYTFSFRVTNYGGLTDTITYVVHAVDPAAIEKVAAPGSKSEVVTQYNLNGQRCYGQTGKGVQIIRRTSADGVVTRKVVLK